MFEFAFLNPSSHAGTIDVLQDSQPRSVIALWKANLEQPKFYHTDTSVIIVDSSNSTSKSKFLYWHCFSVFIYPCISLCKKSVVRLLNLF